MVRRNGALSTFVKDAVDVVGKDVFLFEAAVYEMFRDRDSGSADSGKDDLRVFRLFACYFETVQNTGCADDPL